MTTLYFLETIPQALSAPWLCGVLGKAIITTFDVSAKQTDFFT